MGADDTRMMRELLDSAVALARQLGADAELLQRIEDAAERIDPRVSRGPSCTCLECTSLRRMLTA